MRTLQAEIIQTLGVQPTIDSETEINRSISLLKDYLIKTGLKTLVLGISGGQDSLLAGKLAQLAVMQLRAETGDKTYQFIAMRLPYSQQSDESDAMAAIAWQGADQTVTVNIKDSVEGVVTQLEANGIAVTDFNKGNIKARERMIAQYGVAAAKQGVVIGTDHAAEALAGFYTKFGDGAADVTPLYRLNKRQGRQLLAYLDAPKNLYEKVPTADLEEDRPALPDEEALGVTYDAIDDYLEGKEVSDADANQIEHLYTTSEHKRRQPVTVFDEWWR
ncbi:ammonia-dependent NAD(+) synthetase [Weissella sagaensis]|uniref:NH(3)-dependent NAD(+) synthetase n=1 Tax=Weissella sagaensis TaxID=2559928 RepID=A0ABW1RVE8_9LACO|nr:ammonia-dependent NAD(+) synthetase [Weissella sagaensis]KAA8434702.1 ammonia-dependent NAD(+) synthetase [Weissella paramesenteroides]MBU7567372.1 ammonia-dependent NAD(+) synthetase [Weissella hellenica]KAA8437661.1 ammonia-dependent NAD(+) synthetase [Weissella paramesenteroides]QDJ59405.1 ammonia-dependent NAD(+) synthetase [Weissella hellenica]QEA56718.1 ammonia-dependent NAD(+) synthetase [Weissella hellenica]